MTRNGVMRITRRVTLCLMIGAAITVAVAWIVAVTVAPNGPGQQRYGGQTVWSLPSGIGDGWSYWTMSDVGTLVVVRIRAHFDMQGELKDAYLDVRERQVPTWSGVHQAPPPDTAAPQPLFLEDARGWPLMALRSETQVDLQTAGPRRTVLHYGILLDAQPGSEFQHIVLPVRPIWPAFIIDSMLFGTIAYAGIFGPGTLRRRLRRRHGQCEPCGYDLRAAIGEACPECGAAIARGESAAG